MAELRVHSRVSSLEKGKAVPAQKVWSELEIAVLTTRGKLKNWQLLMRSEAPESKRRKEK